MKEIPLTMHTTFHSLRIVVLAFLFLLCIALPGLAIIDVNTAGNVNLQSAGTIIDKNGEEIATTPDPSLIASNQTPHKPTKWGWLIGIYLFLGGVGGGAYLTAFLAEKGFFGKTAALKRAGYYIGAPAVAIGALLLVFDLGQGLHQPLLIFRMFFHFTSVMTWGIYILSLFIVAGLVKGFLAWRNSKSPSVLSWIGAILAVATMVYTGLLLYASKAIPLWETPLIPVLFVVSALSTGLSATMLLSHWVDRGDRGDSDYRDAIKTTSFHLALIGLEVIVFLAFIIPALTGARGGVAKLSAHEIVFGSMALFFWIAFIFIGLVVPAIYYCILFLKERHAFASSSAGNEVTRKRYKTVSLLCDGAVLLGGLTLRCLIVFAAFPVWDGLLR